MQTGRLLIAFGAFAAMAAAQPSAGVAGPVTGFVITAGAIRPMLGVPGGAYLGASVLATGLDAALVSPDGSAALAVQQVDQLVLYNGLRSGLPTALGVKGSIAGPDHLAWAPNSASAAVYSSRTAQGQMVTSLGSSPAAGPPIDLAGLPGTVTVLACDGQRLILGVSGDSGGIYLAGAAGGIQRIASAASPSAIALAGASLYFSDAQSERIFQVPNYAGTPVAMVFSSDTDIASPAGLQVSADGQRLYVANAGSRKLAVYDIASRSAVQSIALNFTPTRLDLFGDSSVFLMNSAGQGPIYVVRDAAAGRAAVYFVPDSGKKHPTTAPIRPK
jgi:hypothetical protein